MTAPIYALLRDPQQAHQLLSSYVWPKVKAALLAGCAACVWP